VAGPAGWPAHRHGGAAARLADPPVGHFLPLGTIAWGISLYFLFGTWSSWAATRHHRHPADQPVRLELDAGAKIYYLIWAFVLAAVFTTHNLLDSREGRAIRRSRAAW
jgi:branched-chain amino acid transport system permease protein